MTELQPFQQDERWFYGRCHRDKKPQPASSTAHAFAERVAIKLDAIGSMQLNQAREQAYQEYLQGHLT